MKLIISDMQEYRSDFFGTFYFKEALNPLTVDQYPVQFEYTNVVNNMKEELQGLTQIKNENAKIIDISIDNLINLFHIFTESVQSSYIKFM